MGGTLTDVHEQDFDFVIRRLSPEDVRETARLHFALFGSGEMRGNSIAKLGEYFLENIYYRQNLDNPYFFCDIARYKDEIAGFSVYSLDRKQVYKTMLRKHWFDIGLHTLGLILRKPSKAPILLSNIRYLQGEEVTWIADVNGWWQVAGVPEKFRSKEFKAATGIKVADRLFQRMEDIMLQNDCLAWYGVVHPENIAINQFLLHHGGVYAGKANAQGMEMSYYIKHLSEQAVAKSTNHGPSN